jgi:hypothetical protein
MKIYEVADRVEQLEDKLYDMKSAKSNARNITKKIKYSNVYSEIVAELGTLAEDNGLELDEYQIRQVYQAQNHLESEIYQLEEIFDDAIRELRNKIDDAEEE